MKKTPITLMRFLIILLFIAVPLESVAVFEGFSLTKLVSLILICVWLFDGMKLPKGNSIQYYFLLVFYSLLTCIWSINVEETFHAIISFLIPSVVLALIVERYTESYNHLILYGAGYAIGCMVLAGSLFLGYEATLANVEFEGQERMTALGQDQNALAFLLGMGCVIILHFILSTKQNVLRFLCIILVSIFGLAIMNTGSRTGVIILGVVLLIFLVSLKSAKAYITTAIIGLFCFSYLIAFVPESLIERFSETSELIEGGDFSNRGYIWASAFDLYIHNHVLLGVGYSNFSELLMQNIGWRMASHNTYLTYLVEFGILGVGIFILLLVQLIKKTKMISAQSHTIYIYNYIVPLFVVMLTLETEYKRWMFLIMAILFSWVRVSNLSQTSVK